MRENKKRQQILNVLAKSIRAIIENEELDFEKLEEIRLRIDQPLIVEYENVEMLLPSKAKNKHIVTKEEIRETMDYICKYSLYAYEQELKQGFVTIEGGHRAGVMGKVILENNRVKNLQYISSVNIRVAHEIIGCADSIMQYITKNREVCHTLIISPPRCGKTTLIRDIIRQISDGNQYVRGCTVGVVDERSELGGCYLGVAQNHLGMRTDILDCCPKAEGMIMLIRSMAPHVLAIDEIGTSEDVHAVEYAMQCGCKLIASVHGMDMEEASQKPVLGDLIRKRRFERYVILEKMLYIRHLIYLLKGELEYCVAPIGEVFGKIAQRVKQPYKNWLLAMQKQVENREADEFFTIWMRTIDQYLGELSLKPSHLIQLKELGCYLGQNHTAVESRNLQLYIERLELEIETDWKLSGSDGRNFSGSDIIVIRRDTMTINLIFKIAAVGILVSILSQVLKHSGRDEQAFLVSFAALVLVLSWVLPYIYDLFITMKQLFAL